MNENPLDFTGRAALVTGAASGMSLAAARAFAEAGAVERRPEIFRNQEPESRI